MPSLQVHCCTWNVGDEGPPGDDLKQLLGLKDANNLPDIIAVALQEVVNPSEWRKTLMEFCHPSGFVLVKDRNCWAIWIYVFVRRSLLCAITNIESEVTPSGYAGVMGNKGGVSVRFEICGVNVIFLSCHFTAHAGKTKDRVNDYMDIIDHQTFRDDDVHSILDHDYVFWMGDLNFRLEHTDKNAVEELIRAKRYKELLSHDQLLRSKKRRLIFEDFLEGEIDFPPTFKFDKGSDQYDSSSKQRVPAWTDRILYMAHRDFATDYYSNVIRDSGQSSVPRNIPVRGAPSEVAQRFPSNRRASFGPYQPEIKLNEYKSLPDYKSSDHRPVMGSFSFSVPYRWFSLPVSFIEPVERSQPFSKDMEFSYTILDPPALLRMSETDKILTARPIVAPVDFIQLMLLSAMGKLNQPELEANRDPSPSAPQALEQASWDWIGVYPADFVDLEKGYITYLPAPKTTKSAVRELISATSKKAVGSVYTGKVPSKYLAPWKNSAIQLIYWNRTKGCPQGYSPIIQITSR